MAKSPVKKTAKKKEEPAVPEYKEETFGPFDFIKSIQTTKVDIIRTSENPTRTEKDYNAYLTNMALSFHVDSILYANELNVHHGLDNLLQYDYLINTIRSMKRPYVWLKKSKDEDIQFLKDSYGMNTVRAKETYKVLGAEKVAELRKSLVKGGVVGKK